MKGVNSKKIIDDVIKVYSKIQEPVAEFYSKRHKELAFLDGRPIKYLPTPFEIAEYYNIKYRFIDIEGDIPSYLSDGQGVGEGLPTIYISKKYPMNSYKARLLCAHELGHFFLHQPIQPYAMNNDPINSFLKGEDLIEYQANIFAVLAMPQIMGDKKWCDYSMKKLNREVYRQVVGYNF